MRPDGRMYTVVSSPNTRGIAHTVCSMVMHLMQSLVTGLNTLLSLCCHCRVESAAIVELAHEIAICGRASTVSNPCAKSFHAVFPAVNNDDGGFMPTILIVESDADIRRVIDAHLAASGFDVVSTPDTVRALQQLASRPHIDLCIVDIVMPSNVPDGETFAEAVRRQRPSTPVVIMAGCCANAAEASDVTRGPLPGPVDLSGLVTEIERQLTLL
jgi:CheY-like chemotaxis protein